MKIHKFFTKKKDTQNTPPQDKKSSKWQRGVKFTGIFILTVIVLSLISFTIYGVWAFFDTYTFQTPIIIQSPLVPRHVNSIVSPLPGRKKTTQVFNLGKIADTIYQKESSSGKADGCTKMGLYNGYGWRQNSFEWNCYSSREEVRGLVIAWLEDHIKNGDIRSALCYYNQGVHTNTCSYAIAY